MKSYLILCAILTSLAACSATGPRYSNETKGNVVVYRSSQVIGAASSYHIQIGDRHCGLKNGGFFPVFIKKKEILTAGWAQGTLGGSVEVNPGDYIRVEHNVGNSLIGGTGMMFGAVGGAIGAQTSGDFMFNKIPASIAKSELQTLNQDCVN